MRRAAEGNRDRTPAPAEQQVAQVLEPGERLLWSDRANSDAIRARARRFALPLPLALLLFAGVFLWMLGKSLGIANVENLIDTVSSHRDLTWIVTAALVIPILGSVFGPQIQSRSNLTTLPLSQPVQLWLDGPAGVDSQGRKDPVRALA